MMTGEFYEKLKNALIEQGKELEASAEARARLRYNLGIVLTPEGKIIFKKIPKRKKRAPQEEKVTPKTGKRAPKKQP
ncbi:hypothetical protein [Chitinophaga qingshengii]|uniref:Histone H1 n=1 Tax=Chitinophaga qingshengii TaxID=1569794 RepID=A0ABR7TMU5_9BACT|nr:hypothetical protein [Chitinophaga qingshengii]MBC9931805.1 hypothetical protein [Chitinophaga qingshengii]